jgi:hypothetical protein
MRGTMFRANIEPMPDNPPDRVPGTGLWKVVIRDDQDRFVRTDKDNISYVEAKKLSDKLNGWMNTKARGAGN